MGYQQINLDVETKHVTRKINFKLYLCALTADILMAGNGAFIGWTGIMLPRLKSSDPNTNPLGSPITTFQSSLIVAIPFLGLFSGNLVASKISESLGRRGTLRCLAACTLCFLIAIAFLKNFHLYCVCLFFNSSLLDIIFINIFIYNNEISEIKNRGKLGCLASVFWPIGVVYSYIFGSITSIRNFSLICGGPACIHLLLSFFLVESPLYLASKGKVSKALESFRKLRLPNTEEEIQDEFELIKKGNQFNKKVTFLDLFKSKSTKRALIISAVILLAQEVSGVIVIMYHIPTIFIDAGVNISGNLIGTIVNLVQVVVYLLVAFLVDNFGKRKLFLTSTASCSCTMFFLAVYFYLKRIEHPISEQISWLAALLSILFILGHCLGLGTLALVMVNELFISEFKSMASSLTIAVADLVMFLVGFTFPLISDLLGVYVCFLSYSFLTAICFVTLCFILPETSGKSSLEIQNMLKNV